jgi:Ca2+/Na+ antiporter
MNRDLSLAAMLIAVFALIGYFLMRIFLPTFHYGRLLFLGSLALVAVFLMFLHRRQKRKKKCDSRKDKFSEKANTCESNLRKLNEKRGIFKNSNAEKNY